MEWIVDFYKQALYYPMLGYKELIIKYQNHLTEKSLQAFFYRIKREILHDIEPVEISWRDGTPMVTFIKDNNRCIIEAAIAYKSYIDLNEDQLEKIDCIAQEFLRKKSYEELKLAKEAAREATQEYHEIQKSLGFEEYINEEDKAEEKENWKMISKKQYLRRIYDNKPFHYIDVEVLLVEALLCASGCMISKDKNIKAKTVIELKKKKKNGITGVLVYYTPINFKNNDERKAAKVYVPGFNKPWEKSVNLHFIINGWEYKENEIQIELAEPIYNSIRLGLYEIISGNPEDYLREDKE